MQRYDVYQIENKDTPVVLLQYPGIDTGIVLLAAPLIAVHRVEALDIITPQVTLAADDYFIGTHLLAAIRKDVLGQKIGNLIEYEYEISRAISRLFFGN